MPKNSTSTTEMTQNTTTDATAVKKRVRRQKKETEPVAEAAPVAEPAPVDAAAAGAEEPKEDGVSEIDALKQHLQDAIAEIKAEKAKLNDIGKNLVTRVEALVKETNQVLRKNLKRKRRTGANANSGFLKPKPVTDELCSFLNRPSGAEMSRAEVTRMICDYIKKNNLQKPENHRIIVPDKSLTSLLRLKKDETLTYFMLQSKLNHLFVKPAEATA